MTFSSRQDAGQKLGQRLLADGARIDLILALPRGGVIVGREVATLLRAPLDVLLVRKIGHPRFREFAVGALAEPDVVVLDSDVLERSRLGREDLEEIIAEESARLSEYRRKFASTNPSELRGKIVAIVDDGLATGATTEAAVRSARERGASRIIVAVPVSSVNGSERLTKVADQFVALLVDPGFEAVGQYYRSFPQTTDDEVMAALRPTD